MCVHLDIDKTRALAQEFGVKNVPWLLFVDPAGRTKLLEHVGPINVDELLALLEKAIKQKRPQVKPWTLQTADFTFRYKDRVGFSLESKDKNLILDLWTFQMAQAIILPDKGFNEDTFRIRHSRYGIQATLFNDWTLFTHIDYGFDKPLLDLYAEYQITKPINLRLGRFKTPMGQEFLPRRDFWDFVEQTGYLNSIWPRRDVGAMIYGGGGYAGIYARYFFGAFNGVQDGHSDVDGHKDLAGRFVLSPFPSTEFDPTFAIAFTQGRTKQSLNDFNVTTESITKVFHFTSGTAYRGKRSRISLESEILYRNFSLGAEWAAQDSPIAHSTLGQADWDMDAWSTWASWLITGEKKSRDEKLIPLTSFGAFELAGRYSAYSNDNDISRFAHHFTKWARTSTLGINWYPTQFNKIMIDYSRSKFDRDIPLPGGKTVDDENTFLFGVVLYL